MASESPHMVLQHQRIQMHHHDPSGGGTSGVSCYSHSVIIQLALKGLLAGTPKPHQPTVPDVRGRSRTHLARQISTASNL